MPGSHLSEHPRSQRALLDHWLPEWEIVMEKAPHVFIQRWMEETGQSREQAWRWKNKANALLTSDLLSAGLHPTMVEGYLKHPDAA